MRYDPERKLVELEPDEYKTEPRAGEPFFGAGWPVAVGLVIAIAITAYVVHDGGTIAKVIGPILGVVAYTVVTQIADAFRS